MNKNLMICNRAKRCEEESCSYRVPHELNDDCEIVCVEGGHCVKALKHFSGISFLNIIPHAVHL